MSAEAWLEKLTDANPSVLWDVAKYLAEVDKARQELRDKGYGEPGDTITEQVSWVPDRNASPDPINWNLA